MEAKILGEGVIKNAGKQGLDAAKYACTGT